MVDVPLTDAQEQSIKDAVSLITAPAPVDNGSLIETARRIRQVASLGQNDPKSPYYQRPDLVAAAETNIKVAMARANIVEPVETVQSLAEKAHDAAFDMPMNENLAELIDTTLEQLAGTRSDADLAAQAERLRQVTGVKEYDALLAQARHGLNPGQVMPRAATCSLPILRLLAAHGRFNDAYQRTAPRI